MSSPRSPASSETRSPVWTASSIRAWSRWPAQVVRSGLASSASTSGEVGDHGGVVALVWDGEDALDQLGGFGGGGGPDLERGGGWGCAGVAGSEAVCPS